MGVPGGASSQVGSIIWAHVEENSGDSCAQAVVAVAVVNGPVQSGGSAPVDPGLKKRRIEALPLIASQLSSATPNEL